METKGYSSMPLLLFNKTKIQTRNKSTEHPTF